MTAVAPSSFSMPALTDPYYAPLSAEWQSCPPSMIRLSPNRCAAAATSVAGGKTPSVPVGCVALAASRPTSA